MDSTIQVHEIKGFAERFGGKEASGDSSFFTIGDDWVPIVEEEDIVWLNGFTLEVFEHRFAALYVSERGYSLVWPGRIDFAHLYEEAVCSLASQLTAGKLNPTSDDTKILDATVVSFIIKGEPDEAVKYRLADPDGFRKAKKALENPEMISFARYDFTFATNWSWQLPAGLRFYFTAENPLYSGQDGCELGIKQPRTQYCSRHLLKWIIDHHDKQDALRNVDVGECVALIERLMLDPQDSP